MTTEDFAKHVDKIRGVSRAKILSYRIRESDVDDIIQNTVEYFLPRLNRIHNPDRIEFIFLKKVGYMCKDYIRDSACRDSFTFYPEEIPDESESGLISKALEDYINIRVNYDVERKYSSDSAESAALFNIDMEDFLAILTPLERKTFMSRVVDGKSFKEIAEEEGRKPLGIRSRLRDVRVKKGIIFNNHG